MHRIQKLILSVLLIAAVFSGTAVNAAAANLPNDVIIVDQDGMSVSSDGQYLIDLPDLHPGDEFTKVLNISNLTSYSFSISMTAEPLTETGPIELLNEIHLTLTMNGNQLYDGRVRGDEDVNMIQNALDLGNYNSGDTGVLEISLKVDPDMQTYYTKSEAFLKWNFVAIRVEDEKPPYTGLLSNYGMYFVVGGIVITIMILLVLKKRQKNKEFQEN
ncbi:MAG: hypothetical protein LBI03_05725 [Clostridiales bacterium]|jgi:hypothetical protein|nr:hypothetical protein [Clostridiales bacterium]